MKSLRLSEDWKLRTKPTVILAPRSYVWLWVRTKPWGWSLNSEFATLGALMSSHIRVEIYDTITDLTRWHFPGSQPPMKDRGQSSQAPSCLPAISLHLSAEGAPRSMDMNGMDIA